MSHHWLTQAGSFLDDWLQYQAGQCIVPGFAVSVSYGNTLAYSRAFGYADLYAKQRLTPKHIFNIGSQSKMLTAILVMQLIKEGKLRPYDRVIKHIPWLAKHPDPKYRHITVEQLLWHGAGLMREGRQADYWQLKQPFPDLLALQATVLDSELITEGASRVKYSNVGYALLGQIIENTEQIPYADVAEARIIAPLGLTSTFVDYDAAKEARVATGYTRHINEQRLGVPKDIPANALSPAIGWYSTVEDMGRIVASLYGNDDTLLSNSTKEILLYGERGQWQPSDAGRDRYGLGFMAHDLEGRQILGHGGTFVGHRTCSYFDPGKGLGVMVMSNAHNAPAAEIAFGIFDVLAYFEQYAQTAPLPALKNFDVLLENIFGVKRVLVTAERIIGVDLEGWTPFDTIEVLTVVDPDRLKITNTHYLLADGEYVNYNRERGLVRTVNYAGHTMHSRTTLKTPNNTYG
ncbi:MAG: serine hydrolase domain-containing protein [Patescibacteria group bacterium]